MEHLQDMSFKARIYRFLSTPFILGLAIPILILDLLIEIYHRICFFLYGIEYVKRNNYVRVWDRGKLGYLNPLQKIFCVYCGYVNGVFPYWSEIASRTERYWCGIKHKMDGNMKLRESHKTFAEYNDVNEFHTKYKNCKLNA